MRAARFLREESLVGVARFPSSKVLWICAKMKFSFGEKSSVGLERAAVLCQGFEEPKLVLQFCTLLNGGAILAVKNSCG